MGVVYKKNLGLIKKPYIMETRGYTRAVIDPTQAETSISLAAITPEEVEALILKVDALAQERESANIANLVSNSMEDIITLVRAVKFTGPTGPYRGILGTGTSINIEWLRPKDIGNPMLRGSAAAARPRHLCPGTPCPRHLQLAPDFR